MFLCMLHKTFFSTRGIAREHLQFGNSFHTYFQTSNLGAGYGDMLETPQTEETVTVSEVAQSSGGDQPALALHHCNNNQQQHPAGVRVPATGGVPNRYHHGTRTSQRRLFRAATTPVHLTHPATIKIRRSKD